MLQKNELFCHRPWPPLISNLKSTELHLKSISGEKAIPVQDQVKDQVNGHAMQVVCQNLLLLPLSIPYE